MVGGLVAIALALSLGAEAPLLERHHRAAQAADCGAAPYDCAVAQVERQQFDAAIRTLQQILDRSPHDLKALNLLGIALTNVGKPDEASQRFQEALKIDPAFSPARKNLAINEFARGKHKEAKRLFEQVLERVPDDEIAHVHVAEIHFEAKHMDAALPHYEKSGARVAQNPIWTLHYAACLLDQGDRSKAVAILDQLGEDDAASRFEAGVMLGKAKAHAEAARFFGSARKGAKDPYPAAYNQTLMSIDAGDYDGAIRVAAEIVAHGQAPAELYNLVSRAYVKAGRIQEAYDSLRTAARLEPNVDVHYLDLATICLEHENFDLGLEIVDVGLHHRPGSGALHLQRGVLLAMKGQAAQAEREFDAARTLMPESPVPYIALAMSWMEAGQSEKAVEMLRARVREGRQEPLIAYTLGVALLRSGADPADPSGQEAIDAFETAVRLSPDLAPARLQLGKLLLKRGDVPQAIAHLEKAVALEPDSAAPAYSLAQAYRKAGETNRAQQLLARVSKLNAQERGDDPDREMKRMVVRIVRESR